MIYIKKLLSIAVAFSILFTGSMQSVQAAMISSEQVAQHVSQYDVEQNRARILSALTRDEVRNELINRGVDPSKVQERVAALTDEEVRDMSYQIENAPAGGFLGALALIFLILLVTDILGFTKVFTFTR